MALTQTAACRTHRARWKVCLPMYFCATTSCHSCRFCQCSFAVRGDTTSGAQITQSFRFMWWTHRSLPLSGFKKLRTKCLSLCSGVSSDVSSILQCQIKMQIYQNGCTVIGRACKFAVRTTHTRQRDSLTVCQTHRWFTRVHQVWRKTAAADLQAVELSSTIVAGHEPVELHACMHGTCAGWYRDHSCML